jgi:hypothetical protein
LIYRIIIQQGVTTKSSTQEYVLLRYNELELLNVSKSKTTHIRFGVFPPYCSLSSKVCQKLAVHHQDAIVKPGLTNQV